MKRATPEEYRANLIRMTAAWLLVLDEDELTATEEIDMVAIRKAKDTLLSIDEEVADYEQDSSSVEIGDEEPDLLPVGLE